MRAASSRTSGLRERVIDGQNLQAVSDLRIDGDGNANVLLSVRFASSSECSHPCDSAAPCAAAMLSTKIGLGRLRCGIILSEQFPRGGGVLLPLMGKFSTLGVRLVSALMRADRSAVCGWRIEVERAACGLRCHRAL